MAKEDATQLQESLGESRRFWSKSTETKILASLAVVASPAFFAERYFLEGAVLLGGGLIALRNSFQADRERQQLVQMQ